MGPIITEKQNVFSTLTPVFESVHEALLNKEPRDAFLTFTIENGLMTRPAWRLMNDLKMHACEQQDGLENARVVSSRLVNIPSSSCKET